MERRTRYRLFAALAGIVVLAFAIWFLRPQPVLVDLGQAHVGTLEIKVEEEARTRVRNIYTVSAPVAGRVVRNPLVAGEPITKDETVVAVLRPTVPAFLDERSRGELRATLTAAAAEVELTGHEIRRLETDLALARSHLVRAQALAERNVLSTENLEQARRSAEASEHALGAARAKLEVQRNKQAAIQAQLGEPEDFDQKNSNEHELRITAPVSGEVLRVLQESETIVPAGTALIEVANTSDLEIKADLLSTDAVQVKAGAPARILDWGGPPLEARVAHIDPTGFEKTSALGIEELRVPVILELVSPEQEWRRLKHNFRVIAEITLSQTDDALLVPSAALFRHGESWAVFVIEQGRASLRDIDVGLGNDTFTEVTAGLSEGEWVVTYPDERIADGTRVAARAENWLD